MARSRRQRVHHWVEDSCTRCGLHRRETWLLDDVGREVMALVWTDESGDMRVQPFPPLLGLVPPVPPALTREELLGDLPVGPEPPCLTARQRATQPKRPEM